MYLSVENEQFAVLNFSSLVFLWRKSNTWDNKLFKFSFYNHNLSMKNNFTLGHLYRKIKSFLVQLNGWKTIWTGNMIRQINLFLVHRCSDRYWLLITAVTYYMLDSSSEWTCNLAFVFTSSVFTFMWSDLISWNLLSLIRCLIRWPLSTWNLCFLFSFIDQRAYREPAAALPDTYPVWSPSTDWSWR